MQRLGFWSFRVFEKYFSRTSTSFSGISLEESDLKLKKLKNELRKQYLISTKSPRVLGLVSIINNFLRDHTRALPNLNTLGSLVNESKSKKEQNILQMVSFLWIYEGFYMTLFDLFCAILVFNDHDLYDPFNHDFVKSPDDIAKVQIPIKEKFLEKHEFGALIRGSDKDLRNRIAHHDFSLDGNDNVVINGKPTNIATRVSDLMNFIVKTDEVLAQCVGKQTEIT